MTEQDKALIARARAFVKQATSLHIPYMNMGQPSWTQTKMDPRYAPFTPHGYLYEQPQDFMQGFKDFTGGLGERVGAAFGALGGSTPWAKAQGRPNSWLGTFANNTLGNPDIWTHPAATIADGWRTAGSAYAKNVAERADSGNFRMHNAFPSVMHSNFGWGADYARGNNRFMTKHPNWFSAPAVGAHYAHDVEAMPRVLPDIVPKGLSFLHGATLN
jgi:hypothetical protein